MGFCSLGLCSSGFYSLGLCSGFLLIGFLLFGSSLIESLLIGSLLFESLQQVPALRSQALEDVVPMENCMEKKGRRETWTSAAFCGGVIVSGGVKQHGDVTVRDAVSGHGGYGLMVGPEGLGF